MKRIHYHRNPELNYSERDLFVETNKFEIESPELKKLIEFKANKEKEVWSSRQKNDNLLKELAKAKAELREIRFANEYVADGENKNDLKAITAKIRKIENEIQDIGDIIKIKLDVIEDTNSKIENMHILKSRDEQTAAIEALQQAKEVFKEHTDEWFLHLRDYLSAALTKEKAVNAHTAARGERPGGYVLHTSRVEEITTLINKIIGDYQVIY